MSQATMTEAPTRQPMNGVNIPGLFATINAVAGQPELAKEYPYILSTGARTPLYWNCEGRQSSWTPSRRPPLR